MVRVIGRGGAQIRIKHRRTAFIERPLSVSTKRCDPARTASAKSKLLEDAEDCAVAEQVALDMLAAEAASDLP